MTDLLAEAEAAKLANLRVALSVRPGNAELPDVSKYDLPYSGCGLLWMLWAGVGVEGGVAGGRGGGEGSSEGCSVLRVGGSGSGGWYWCWRFIVDRRELACAVLLYGRGQQCWCWCGVGLS